MKMHRKWTVLILLTLLLVISGCAKDDVTTTPPPPVKTDPPVQEIKKDPTPAPAVDDVEEPQPKSIAEMEEDFRNRGLLGDVFFDFDRSELRADARERLARNAEFMNSAQGRSLTFKIEGHCDERGTNEYNIALGQSRATTALDYLASLGVARDRFQTVSFGEERPFCTESTEACWQKNRRARFVVTGQ